MSKRGRPRGFDEEEALDRAVQVFQAKGYGATTLDDLTTAMGINRPSLYGSFGNKEALFHRVLDRYQDRYAREADQVLNRCSSTAKAIETWLQWAAEWHWHHNQRQGCLIVNSTSDCRPDQPQICDHILRLQTQNEEMLFQRLHQGVGVDLPQDADCRGLAQFFNGVIQGIAVLVREQQNPEAIQSLIRYAMGAWPY